MKALLLLAATGLGTLVALPHLPDVATVKNQFDAVLATASTQLSQVPQPAQPEQITLPQLPASDGTAMGDPASTPAPLITKASPDDVRQTYGNPEHVERNVYGEVWYYPVYIIYFRNGYVHRVHRPTSSTASTTITTNKPFVAARTTAFGPFATTTSLSPQTQPWRFSTNSSLGTVTLNGSGVQRTSNFVPRQTAGAPATTGATYSNYRSAGSVSTGGGSTTGMCNRPASTSTVTAPRPVVQRTAPVAPVYYGGARVGY